MKNITLMLVFLLPYLIVNAQDQLVVIICPAKTLPVAKYNVASLEQEPQIPDNDPTNNMYLGKNPLVFKDNIYIVRFFNTTSNKLLKIGDLDKEICLSVTLPVAIFIGPNGRWLLLTAGQIRESQSTFG